jgi:hypothetical protein
MGLGDWLDELDTSEDHLWGHGFDREVCEGCPHKTGDSVERCGCCGCPLLSLDKTDAPPESCPRLDEHAEEAA